MIEFILSLFSEKKCFSCQKLWHFFCPECNNNLKLYKPYCYVCKKSSCDFLVHNTCQTYFRLQQVIVLTRYRNSGVKKLLRHAKYYNKYKSYRDLLIWNEDFFLDYIDTENSVFIPVPMYFLRRWKRWYNQSEIITQNLSKICNIPMNNNFIKRVRNTKQQSHLSQSQRSHNLDNAFKLWKSKISKNTTIYLIDDVVSTGSTLNSIAEYLYENWYKNIRAIVLASD